MTCRTCKFLGVAPNRAGKRVPRSDKIYRCLVDVPVPIVPASVTGYYNWKWPPTKSAMVPDDGADCPLWEAFKP